MTNTYRVNVGVGLDNVAPALVAKVAAGAVGALCPVTSSAVVGLDREDGTADLYVVFQAQGEAEAVRTAKVAAAAVKPLVDQVQFTTLWINRGKWFGIYHW